MTSMGYLLPVVVLILAIGFIFMGYTSSKSGPPGEIPVPPSPIRPDDVVIDREIKSQYCSVVAIQGRRGAMEDTFSHILSTNAHLFGVYDGHGSDVIIYSLLEYLNLFINNFKSEFLYI